MARATGPASRPTVVFVAARATRGGPNQSLLTVLEALGDVHRVVAAPAGLGGSSHCDERVTLAPSPMPSRPQRVRGALHLAWWALRNRRRITAFHANGVSGLNLAGLAVLLTRRPAVVWAHASRLSDVSLRSGRFWARRLKRLRWAAVSAASLDLLDKAGLADPADVTIVPNPIGPDRIASRHADGPFTIAYLGGPATFKGIHVIPGVIELLTDRHVHWLVVVGSRRPGDPDNPVLTAIQALARPEVQTSGWVSDPREVYATASVVFCPSFRESFGRVAAEAMVNGIPVVASDLPAFRELIGDNEAGLLFPPGDANAAASALARLVDNADLRERLGQAGRARAARFAPAVAVETFAELYGTR